MQFFDRRNVPPPAHLLGSEAQRLRMDVLDLLSRDQERLSQTRAPRRHLDLDEATVVGSLKLLFQGRCAFCESQSETTPHRFRPPSEASPSTSSPLSHLYYLWLAETWDNIYPICKVCYPEDPKYFPVIGQRSRIPSLGETDFYVANGRWPDAPPMDRGLLLDPCRDKTFYNHLSVSVRGMATPLSRRGEATIDYFNFNNALRVGERARAIEDGLRELRDLLTLDYWGPDQLGTFEFSARPMGGMWYLYLRRLAQQLMRANHHPGRISRAGIRRFFTTFSRRPNCIGEFSSAIDALARLDDAGPVRPQSRGTRAIGGARLVAVQVQNFKGLEDLSFRVGDGGLVADPSGDLAPALLILGENAAGKSSLLEAIAMALSDDAALSQLDLASKNLILDPGFMGSDDLPARENGRVVLTFKADDESSEDIRVLELGVRQRLALSGKADVPPVFAYGAFRQFTDKTRRYSPARSITSLFRSDAVLSNPDRWLLGLKDGPFRAVVRALRDVFAADQDFDAIRKDEARSRCVVIIKTEGPNGGVVETATPLSEVSSGFRSVLAMACDVFEGLMHPAVYPDFTTFEEARGVLLVDEIEAHLHPRWKLQIMRGLRRALPNMTIIATTHDPLCLRGMEDGEVMVLHRIAGATSDKTNLKVFVEQLTDLPGVNRLTIQQLLTSDFFSLFSTDSPETEADLARIADILAARAAGRDLSDAEKVALARFDWEIASGLPVGSTEVQRLVQSAVAEFLDKRRKASADQLANLKDKAKKDIIAALGQV